MSLPTSTKYSYTIIVIEIAGGEILENCLKALQQFALDCIVVSRENNLQLQARFKTVKFDVLDQPVPLRRKRGVTLASGDIVILIEDTTIPDATMLEGLSIAFDATDCIAASGPINICSDLPVRYQALACTEYGRYHPTMLFPKNQGQRVIVDRLPGNFICYRRDKLNLLLETENDGLVEGKINHRLLSQGYSLVMLAKLSTTYSGQDAWGARFSTRLHHGWIYAGDLAASKNIGGRVIQTFKSILLPVVLSSRAIRYMSVMKEIRQPVIVAVWIFALELFWSIGEFIGSLAGKPETMERWR